MGTQRPVVIGEEVTDELGGPIAEHHGKKKEQDKKKDVADKIKESRFKKEKVKEELISENDAAEEKTGDEKQASEEGKAKKEKAGKAKVRSKKYKEVLDLIDRKKIYNFEDGIDLVKKTSLSKFDGNVELHLRLLGKTGKPENARGTLKYPHETGKKIRVIILDEAKIEEIEKNKKTDFDLAIATPEMMPKVARLAKILGPKGKMPNPKSGTVSADPEKTKKELEGGLTEYKTDSYGNIHQVIGKVKDDPKDLEANFKALLAVLPNEKIKAVHMCATIGPSLKVIAK